MSTKVVDDLKERKVALLVEDLRLWILSQPHLNSRIDDEFLQAFLRACDFNFSETKIRLDLFYTLKNQIPSVLADRSVNEQLLEICQTGISVFLPVFLNDKGVRLHLSRYPIPPPNQSLYKYADVMKVFFMQAEVNLMESKSLDPQDEIVYIVDLKGASFKQSLKVSLCNYSLTKKIVYLIQDGLPLRINEVHFINVSCYFHCLLRLICSSLSGDIKKKIHLHTSMNSFYKHIPQDFLPVDYGGKNGSMQTCIKQQMKKLIEYETYFEEDHMFGVNESLRRKKN